MDKKKGLGGLAVVLSASAVMSVPYLTDASYDKNTSGDRSSEACSIKSGSEGKVQDVKLDSAFAYTLDELKGDKKESYGLPSGTEIEVKTNKGTYLTKIPTFDTKKEMGAWYDKHQVLDVGDACTVPIEKDGKKGIASDGYIVKIKLSDKAKLAKFKSGNYSYLTNGFSGATEKWNADNSQITINVPGQKVYDEKAEPNINVKFQALYATLRVKKVDSKNNPLHGHKFKVISRKTAEEVGIGTTGVDGTVDFTNIPVGKYRLLEVSRPDEKIPKIDNITVEIKNTDAKKVLVIKNNDSGKVIDSDEVDIEDENYMGDGFGINLDSPILSEQTDDVVCGWQAECFAEENSYTDDKELIDAITKDIEDEFEKDMSENEDAYDKQVEDLEKEAEEYEKEHAIKDEDGDDDISEPSNPIKTGGKEGKDKDKESGTKDNTKDNTKDKNGSVNEVDIDGTEKDDKGVQKGEGLPQTGEDNNKAIGFVGGIIILFGGLMTLMRRKKGEEKE